MNKHPLVPNIHIQTDREYKFIGEAQICGTCNLPDSKCSHNCKRYKEELAKLKALNGKNNAR